ncbi:hypothetical protein ACHQM5_013940 [Ranunculus cassubicifolius]
MNYSNINNNNNSSSSSVVDDDDDNQLWEWNQQDYNPQMAMVKECGDLPHNTATASANYSNKEYASQSKRRRMLQFDTHLNESLLCTENTEYTFEAFEKSQDQEELMDVSQEDIPWESGPYGGNSTSCDGSLDQSSEAWLSNCFNDGCVNLSSDDINLSDFSDVQVDISDFCDITDEMESDTVQVIPTPLAKKTYIGSKSYVRTPTNLVSSIAYPFALIKPCGIHGDVTIKDINHRIHTPAPLPRSIQAPPEEEKHVAVSYPTSAFSGKPVVVKTKIRTEGGKGSITIMRTKG